MLRKTLLGLAAAAAITGATASTASAGVKVHLGFGGFGPYWGGYHHHHYGHCKKVFWGYKKVWTYHGWVKKPIFKKKCYW